ncbi:MAG: alpha/beta fold hydrolase [Nocardioidaceae bacterium]|nr:alpha/beta fold hydrolase [Nocardioidaceae bacterium]MCO5323164.1 alpha/beta hydrolase [Nocardioidaceae bacterium]
MSSSQVPPPYVPPPPPPPPSQAASSPWKALIVAGVVLALVVGMMGAFLIAVGGKPRPDNPAAEPPVSNGPAPVGTEALRKFYDQKIEWRNCGGMDCGSIVVPLNYDEPDAKTIKLAVLRNRAKGEAIGDLLVNPGGPGGSSLEFASSGASQFGGKIAGSYNIIGMDPRGVGASTPLKCLDTKGLDEVLASDPDPDNADEVATLGEMTRKFGDACEDNGGELALHMSTVEVAKDMDILRAALGRDKLDFFGASYGTFMGATYADLFPQFVGRMVLDGALDPSLSNEELTLGQAKGFQTALDAYLEYCVDQGDCPLGDSVEEASVNLRKFLDSVDAKPLDTGTDRELTEGLAYMGIWLPLYARSLWDMLTPALDAAINDGDGSQLLMLSDYYSGRGPKSYKDNSMNALYAVNCLDHNDYITAEEVPAKIPVFEEVSPVFGRSFAYSLASCSDWPIKSGNVTKELRAQGAPPIVVIGTTRDPATPYQWAVSLAEQLESGVLIKRDGDGHTGFNAGNDCVDDAVNKFLVRGVVPPDGLSC